MLLINETSMFLLIFLSCRSLYLTHFSQEKGFGFQRASVNRDTIESSLTQDHSWKLFFKKRLLLFKTLKSPKH